MEELRSQVPDSVPDSVELFEQDDGIYGRDDHGEFKLAPEMRGAAEPQDGRCGAVCKFTEERYGETRYCTAMPESTFVDDGSDYCRLHKSHEALMEKAQEMFKHGYFATNYVNFAKHLDPAKFLFAVEMVGGLFERSEHEFEIEEVERNISTESSNLISEDAVSVDLPVPQNNSVSLEANELWMAALKEVMSQNMQEAIFEDGMQKETVVASADMEGQFTDTITESTEHHLHLPLSRLTGDIKDHLKNGGVDMQDDDGGVITFQQNDYTLDVAPTETDTEGVDSGAAEDFATQLQAEGDAEEIEIE